MPGRIGPGALVTFADAGREKVLSLLGGERVRGAGGIELHLALTVRCHADVTLVGQAFVKHENVTWAP